jgi:peptidoglycan/LPS O-acetylase OafA/YrhL
MFWVILGNTLYLSVLIGFENFDAFSNEIVSTFGFQIVRMIVHFKISFCSFSFDDTDINLTQHLIVLNIHTHTQLLNATYAGDIFFFISGFLVTFHLFDKFHRKTKFAVIVFYIHRLWRLTPTYVLALVFWWQILPLVVSGLYVHSQHTDTDKFTQ